MIDEKQLTEKVRSGDRRSLSRAITIVENEREGFEQVLSDLYPDTGRAWRIGITGPPGAGKSSLTNRLIGEYRQAGHRVGVIAVDPTSPFTGGAILGDRVRMQAASMDDDVFIRSMASRGNLGGLSTKAQDVADLLDAAGFDIVMIETVGVGQSELDIAEATDTTVVVLVPESGDSIQAMKSGLMEIADIFVMNKADRAGSDQAVSALKTILSMRIGHEEGVWYPEVVRTVATKGEGIDRLTTRIASHRDYLGNEDRLTARRVDREKERLRRLAESYLHRRFWSEDRENLFAKLSLEVAERTISPVEAGQKLAEEKLQVDAL